MVHFTRILISTGAFWSSNATRPTRRHRRRTPTVASGSSFPARSTSASAALPGDGVRARVEDCLQRLDTDYLDLIQVHCIPKPALENGEIFSWLRELQQEGKIRAFGASVEDVEQGLIAMQHEGMASLQIIFNLFRQKPTEELLAEAAKREVAIIARLPLNSGLLSGKMSPETTFEAGDHRNYNRDGAAFFVGETFGGIPFEKGLELVEAIRPLVPEGYSMADMAQRFLLDFPEVTTLITGASKPGQPARNAAVSGMAPLSEALHEQLKNFFEESVSGHIRCQQ